MLKQIKSLIAKIIGTARVVGEPIDLTPGGGPRIHHTVLPERELGFNEYWLYVRDQNNQFLKK